MRLIGLAVILAVGLFAAPLATEAQQAGKVYRISMLETRSWRRSALPGFPDRHTAVPGAPTDAPVPSRISGGPS